MINSHVPLDMLIVVWYSLHQMIDLALPNVILAASIKEMF